MRAAMRDKTVNEGRHETKSVNEDRHEGKKC